MARLSTLDVFVVTFRHTDRYSFDTSRPDEIFLTHDAAETAVREMNEALKTMPLYREGEHGYFVETLSDRVDTICEACRNEGQYGSDR